MKTSAFIMNNNIPHKKVQTIQVNWFLRLITTSSSEQILHLAEKRSEGD